MENLFEFIFAQQPVIHKNAVQLLADGAVHQGGGHGGIYPTRQRHDYFIFPNFGFEGPNRGLYERLGGPILMTAADPDDEVVQQLLALGRVRHLGMKLNAVAEFIGNLECRHFHRRRGSDHVKIVGNALDGIGVRHPHLRSFRQSGQ